MGHSISVTINGTKHTNEVQPRLLLVHYIRDVLNLTGTHVGCDTSNCGACTVILNGAAVKSCTLFAVQADGAEIMTIEGLAKDGEMHPIQEGFWEEHGLQCGFCTPGFLIAIYELLENNRSPSEAEILDVLGGQICRCTGYQSILRAVQSAAAKLGAARSAGAPESA